MGEHTDTRVICILLTHLWLKRAEVEIKRKHLVQVLILFISNCYTSKCLYVIKIVFGVSDLV